MFLTWSSLRGAGRQEDRGDVFRHVELAGGVPSGAVEQQDGVGSLGDVAGDFVKMELHYLGVGERQRERRPTPRAGQMAPKR